MKRGPVFLLLVIVGCGTTSSTSSSTTNASAVFHRCTFSGIAQGSEGEMCNPTWDCGAEGRFTLQCTGPENHDCTCGITNKHFIAKLTACESLADPDAINELCGVSLPDQDGSHPSINVVARLEDPAFTAPELRGCGALQGGSVGQDGGAYVECEWKIGCDGPITLSARCNDTDTGFGCRCTIDGKPYQTAGHSHATCDTFDRDAIIKLCGFPVK